MVKTTRKSPKYLIGLSLNIWQGLALLALIGLAFLPIWQAEFIYDDDVHLTEDPYMSKPSGLWDIWFNHRAGGWAYWPLARSFFWLQYQCWGLLPWPYHAVNLLLHGIALGLIYRFLQQMQVPGASFITLLVALHPMQVESVAWVSQQKGLLAQIFYMGCLYFFWQVLKQQQFRFQLGGLLCFTLALLSKSSTITLPVILCFMLYYQRKRFQFSDLKLILPYFLLAFWKLYVELFSTSGHSEPITFNPEQWLLASQLPWVYVGQFLWPYPLNFNSPMWPVEVNEIRSYWGIGLWMMLPAILLLIPKSWRSIVLLLGLTALANLLPVLGLVRFGGMRDTWVADHWAQLALLPLSILFSLSAQRGLQFFLKKLNLVNSQQTRLQMILASCLLLIFMAYDTTYAKVFSTPEKLYAYALEQNPRSWLASNQLGMVALKKGDKGNAKNYFDLSIELNPKHFTALNNRGNLYVEAEDWQQARFDFEQALRARPGYVKAQHNLAVTFLAQGRLQEALEGFTQAIAWQNDYALSYLGRAKVYHQLGQNEAALADLDQALRIQPQNKAWQLLRQQFKN